MVIHPVTIPRQLQHGGIGAPAYRTAPEFSRFGGLDRLFNILLDGLSVHDGPQGKVDGEVFEPPMEILADDAQYLINVEIPGAAEEKLKVEVKENRLHISGEKISAKADGGSDKAEAYYNERRFGVFRRVLTLPDDADYETVKAGSAGGVLSISLQRKKPDQGRVIDISRN
jgi:HSP20 family protein